MRKTTVFSERSLKPLALAPIGRPVRIVEIQGGRNLRNRLAHMGLFPGTVVVVELREAHGPVVINRGGVRIGVGTGMARKILVQPDEADL